MQLDRRRDGWVDESKIQTLVYPVIQTERNRTNERPFFSGNTRHFPPISDYRLLDPLATRAHVI